MLNKNLLNHIKNAERLAPQHERLLDIYSGNLTEYVKLDLQSELSANSFSVASKRIAVINLIQKITNKLSKVYSDKPKRTTASDRDAEILTAYENEAEIQTVMTNAETLLNLNKAFALEPYIENGTIHVRVLAASEFCVYSDDINNPNKPTAFIKFMGSQAKGEKHTVNIYWIYTKDSFMVADSDGEILSQELNPLGTLPFIYVNADSFSLTPKPDNDSFNNSILIPKLLTDLNYAVQYQSHSIMYGIDVDASNLKGNPDSFWSIQSSEGENKKPQLGVLSPSVDVDKVLSLITFTVSEWLSCKGIKPGAVGSLTAETAASGLSKIVDEAEASSVVDKNRLLLVKAEKALWQLIAIMHNTFVAVDLLNIKQGLSDNLDVSIKFPEQMPIKDPAEKRNELKFKLENKLTSYLRALKEANPDMSEDEILKLKLEIEQENQAKAAQAPAV